MTCKRLAIPGVFPRSPITWIVVLFSAIILFRAFQSLTDFIALGLVVLGIVATWTSAYFGGIWESSSRFHVWQGLWGNSLLKRDVITVEYRLKWYRPERPSLCIVTGNGRSIPVPGSLFRTLDQDYEAISLIMAAASSRQLDR